MSQAAAQFCTKCGAAFRTDTTFCTKCGSPRRGVDTVTGPPAQAAPVDPAPSAAAAAPQQHTFVAQAGSAAATAQAAYGTVAQVAGMAGVAVALPWQTVAGDEQPDIRAFLSMAAMPAASQLARSSLRRPGLAMAVTTSLDLGTAFVTGGASAVTAALPRFLLGGATSLFSLVTGTRGGPLRSLTGAVSAVTAVVQVSYTAMALRNGLSAGTPLLTLVPGVVAMTSSLVMATKTALVALRRER